MKFVRLLNLPRTKNALQLKQNVSTVNSFQRNWQRTSVQCKSDRKEVKSTQEKSFPNEIIGQVMSAEANFVRVKVLSTDSHIKQLPMNCQTSIQSDGIEKTDLLCVVRSVLKKMKSEVLVGDFVKVIAIDWPDLRGMVSEVLPRESQLIDPPVANINHILVLVSIMQPKFDPLQSTRFLLEAESTGLPVTLAINKIDLEARETIAKLVERLIKWGYQPKLMSCKSGAGIEDMMHTLNQRISVVIGPSGVGKSSLINYLRKDAQVKLAAQTVKEVSSIGRGRQTTRTISLLELPGGGYLADTPGFNVPDLSAISTQELPMYFPEMVQIVESQGSCKFSNCRHILEPGCHIKSVRLERYPLYYKLLQEIEKREEYERQVLQLTKRKREGNVKRKMRKGGKYQEEVLLETKTHRRVSRTRQHKELRDMAADEIEEGEE